MKILWLCNMIPSAVRAALGERGDGGLWVDHVLSDIRRRADVSLRLLCLGNAEASGTLEDGTEYALFLEKKAYEYNQGLEDWFSRQLAAFRPEVIHIWGTEYGHSLAMVNAAKGEGLAERTVISVQGLVGIYARHMTEGIPYRVCRGKTLRNVLRRDNILRQQHDFELRGAMERRALEQVGHVLGRTDWDRAVTGQYHPERQYHFCNETLRECFYEGVWQYQGCRKHRIFASSCVYPVKGFHYLLEAFVLVLERFPDATLSVTGESFFASGWRDRLRRQYYFAYMERFCREHGLMDKIEFLGNLSAEGMKRAYLNANVFALPSTIENSPNSLGEAMLLGVPCVAADVGGVTNLMSPGEGYVYQSTAPYMLADSIMKVFRLEERAERMGTLARKHALQTHDPERNLQDLLTAYREIAGGMMS